MQGKLPEPVGETSIADEVFPDGDTSKKWDVTFIPPMAGVVCCMKF
jgi:hypothetical protein